MSEDLKKMFNNNELFSDVTFKVENEMINAHKVINNNNNNTSQNQLFTMRNCDQSFDCVFEDTSHFLFVCLLGCDLFTIRIFSCTLSWRNASINSTTN
jgi:2-keto-3-deoxy-galactonokinase